MFEIREARVIGPVIRMRIPGVIRDKWIRDVRSGKMFAFLLVTSIDRAIYGSNNKVLITCSGSETCSSLIALLCSVPALDSGT